MPSTLRNLTSFSCSEARGDLTTNHERRLAIPVGRSKSPTGAWHQRPRHRHGSTPRSKSHVRAHDPGFPAAQTEPSTAQFCAVRPHALCSESERLSAGSEPKEETMGRDKSCATAWLGSSRFTAPTLNRPLRAAELEAMSRAPGTRPGDKAPAALDSCLSGLAMRAPLLCAMFRHP